MKQLAFLLAGLAAAAGIHAAPGMSKSFTELRALGHDASCNSDQQCRTVPVGAKSCGGPESYMAYSSAKVSPDKANALAERYRKERQAENKASGVVSDCRFHMDPGAKCVAGSCQLGDAGGAVVE